MARIGFAITSSFCNLDEVLVQMKMLGESGYEVIPIVSPAVINNDTRFGKGEEFKSEIELISGNEVTTTIIEAERFGPLEPLDALVIAPATGNFISKLANGITDNVTTMASKATLRNGRPLIIGIATNDGLGLNGVNILRLMNTKNIYFIPFGQDDYEKKPNSLVCNFSLLIPTLEDALVNKQYQPIIRQYTKKR